MYFLDPKLGNYNVTALKTIHNMNCTVITVIALNIEKKNSCEKAPSIKLFQGSNNTFSKYMSEKTGRNWCCTIQAHANM